MNDRSANVILNEMRDIASGLFPDLNFMDVNESFEFSDHFEMALLRYSKIHYFCLWALHYQRKEEGLDSSSIKINFLIEY